MDPLAEKYYTISPYAYCAGNPVKYIDPTGKQIEETVYYYQYNIYPLLVVNNERNLNRPTISYKQVAEDVKTLIALPMAILANTVVKTLEVLNSGKSPGLREQEKTTRDGRREYDKNRAEISTAIKENIPDGDGSPKRDLKGVGKVIGYSLFALGFAEQGSNPDPSKDAYEAHMEKMEQNKNKPQKQSEPQKQPESQKQSDQQKPAWQLY